MKIVNFGILDFLYDSGQLFECLLFRSSVNGLPLAFVHDGNCISAFFSFLDVVLGWIFHKMSPFDIFEACIKPNSNYKKSIRRQIVFLKEEFRA